MYLRIYSTSIPTATAPMSATVPRTASFSAASVGLGVGTVEEPVVSVSFSLSLSSDPSEVPVGVEVGLESVVFAVPEAHGVVGFESYSSTIH